MLIPIYLPSKIDAFDLKDNQLSSIDNQFKNINFINCKSQSQYLDLLTQSEISITWKFKRDWYKNAPNLKYLFTPAAGHDWLEKDPDKRVNIINGTFHGKLMGESLLGMILYMNRNFSSLIQSQNKCEWNRNIQSSLLPLAGQTLLIAGFGNIAKEFCRMIKPFNCKIIGLQKTYSNTYDEFTKALLIKENDLIKYLPEVDHLISILPNDKSTNNLFNNDHFKTMKKSAFFYNIGRGNCIDDKLINSVTKDGLIAGAALDVFNEEPLPKSSPLWTNSKIFISPHSSAIFKNYLDLFLDEIKPKLKQIINKQD